MTSEQIQEMLSLGEGQRIEFKPSIKNVDVLGRIVCGFLNTAGGYLICGIQEPGKLIGLDLSEDIVAEIAHKLHNGISPKSLVSIQAQVLEGKAVLVIEVPAGKDVPYAFRDAIYLRVGESTQRADAETIRDIVMRRQIEPERWERRFSFADLDADIDLREIKLAVEEAHKVRRAYFRDATQPTMVLEDFAAAKYGRLTNGGDVLFARNPAVRLPQIRIRAMRYNSNKAGDKFSDMKSFEGPLHSIFEEAYTFIVRNTPSVSRFIKGNPKRQDSPLYPEEAVREALINALAHRDYSAASGGVSIHVFPRRLEIWNSGPLPDGVTEENLPKGHISVLRNPDIAHALYLRGLMEKAGRGSVLMVQQCDDAGLPRPFWKSDPKLGVTVTFSAPEVTAEAEHQVGTKSALSRHQVTQQDTQQDTQQVHSLLVHLETDRSRDELMGLLGLKDRNSFSKVYLNPALNAKVIERTIPDKPFSKNQRYRLTALGEAVRAKSIRAHS